jgi:hypothetical protein
MVVLKVPKGWAKLPFPKRNTAQAIREVAATLKR